MKKFSCLLLAIILTTTLTPMAFAKDEDEVFPELTYIAIQKTDVPVGGMIIVSAEAYDDDSGVKSITAIFAHISENATYTVQLLPNSDENVAEEYSGVLQIPKDAPSGKYLLRRAIVKDRDGNQARYDTGQKDWDYERGRYPLEYDLTFTVRNGKAPSEPTSCEIVKKSGIYTLIFQTAELNVDKATLLFENSENSHKYVFSVNSDDLERDGNYRKEISISPYEPSGVFTLKQIVIKNQDGRSQTWASTIDEDDKEKRLLPITSNFSVKSSYLDVAPPELISISVGKGVRNSADEKTQYPIRATVTDNLSGVEHITIKFKDPVSGDTISKVLRESDHGKANQYAGEMSVKFEQTAGLYYLDSVTVCDYAGNRMIYCTAEDLTDKKSLLPVTARVPVNQ